MDLQSKKVVILRGGSGAGKSTWIQKNVAGAKVFSADHFFMVDGEYKFDFTQLTRAHNECLLSFIAACSSDEGPSALAVDNTSTSIAEIAPYAAVALAHGHEVKVVTLVYDPVVAYGRNIHGTPLSACMKQYERMNEQTKFIPAWWNHSYELAGESIEFKL